MLRLIMVGQPETEFFYILVFHTRY